MRPLPFYLPLYLSVSRFLFRACTSHYRLDCGKVIRERFEKEKLDTESSFKSIKAGPKKYANDIANM